MATTWTRTKTYASIIGEQLAAQDDDLLAIRERMITVANDPENQRTFTEKGLGFKETDDATKLGLIKYQWTEIVPQLIDTGKIDFMDALTDEKIAELQPQFEEDDIPSEGHPGLS